MPIFHAFVLGLVQGLSEFLPISSSGHLLLVPWVAGWDDFDSASTEKAFDVALHIGTLVAAINYLFDRGARDVTAVCIIAAPEGLKTVEEAVGSRGDVTVVVAAVDERLNEKAYIVPGLGDAGDRLYGIV